MCTYNGEKYLREQLESIAAQTLLPCEIVICDDGSTDSTSDIVADFGRGAPFKVKFIRNPKNLGSTKNFEKAIGLCAGEFIALCDQDDIWMPEKLARQVNVLERDPQLAGVFSDATLINDRSQPVGETLWSSISFTPREQKKYRTGKEVSVFLKRSVVTGATLLIRNDVQRLFMPIPQTWVHDGWIAWILILQSKLELVSSPLSLYRVHEYQQCGIPPVSLRARLTRAMQSRSQDHLAAMKQLVDLRKRAQEQRIMENEAQLAAISKKIAHLQARSSLDRNRIMRMIRMIPEIDNYRRFSNGWKSILKDMAMQI